VAHAIKSTMTRDSAWMGVGQHLKFARSEEARLELLSSRHGGSIRRIRRDQSVADSEIEHLAQHRERALHRRRSESFGEFVHPRLHVIAGDLDELRATQNWQSVTVENHAVARTSRNSMPDPRCPPALDDRFDLDPTSRWVEQESANAITTRLCDCIEGLSLSHERPNGQLPTVMGDPRLPLPARETAH
jgi:hypothetical protein